MSNTYNQTIARCLTRERLRSDLAESFEKRRVPLVVCWG